MNSKKCVFSPLLKKKDLSVEYGQPYIYIVLLCGINLVISTLILVPLWGGLLCVFGSAYDMTLPLGRLNDNIYILNLCIYINVQFDSQSNLVVISCGFNKFVVQLVLR